MSTCTKQTAKRRSIRKLIQCSESRLPRGEQGRSCNKPVRRTFTKKNKTESLAGNGEVVARGAFQDPVVN